MKEILIPLFLCSLTLPLVKTILPKGENSPLFPALRLLISLLVLVVSFSPLLSLFNREELPRKLFEEKLPLSLENEEILLKKSQAAIEEAARNAFPETEFTVELYCNENKIPTGILLTCEDSTQCDRIRSFLEENFSLITTVKEKEMP